MLRRVLLIAVFACAPLAVSDAQDSADSSLVHALEQLAMGTRIRVYTVENGIIEGRLAQVTETRIIIIIIIGEREERADVARVSGVWLRHHRAKAGAVTGMTVGVIALGVLYGTLASALCECDATVAAFGEGFFYGGLAGGAVGGLAGAFIGSLSTGWKPYWRREGGLVSPRSAAQHRTSGGAVWASSVGAGAGTRFREGASTQLLLSATIDRQNVGGGRAGLEIGYLQMRKQESVFFLNDTLSRLTVLGGYGTYASLVGSLPMDSLGSVYWLADIGVARHVARNRFEMRPSGQSGPYGESRLWPLFGVGVGTRFRAFNLDLRFRGPVSFAGERHMMISLTGGARLR